MVGAAHRFDDAAGYERFMGRWSRAVGTLFLEWVDASRAMHWLDVGCGSGAFTELIVDRCAPAAVVGIDSAKAQIELACARRIGQFAAFHLGQAETLPFTSATFDAVVSALAVNFIGDRPRALAEMRRVAKPGATMAAYVWDFAAERSPSWPVRRAMRQCGADVPEVPGAKESTLTALRILFEGANLERVETTSFEVALAFPSFEDFWEAQTPSYSPLSKAIAAMENRERARLVERVRRKLPPRQDGSFAYAARASAIKARVRSTGS